MSDVKHTPGPWEAYHVTSAGWSVRRQHEREGYTGLAPICSMAWWQFDIPGIIDDDISEANASLIAAAPCLLAACEKMLRHIDDVKDDADLLDCRKAIADALAKARGKARGK